METSYRALIADALADAFLADGEWTREALVNRGASAIAERPRWLHPMARAVVSAFPDPPRGDRRALSRFLGDRRALRRACSSATPPHVRRWLLPAGAMRETRWPVPSLPTSGDLARWLSLSVGELAWLGDAHGLERLGRDQRLRNYRYAWRFKPSGGYRLLEAPKPRLKAVQRRILHEILAEIPPHDAAHGFRQGRSVLSHASAHASRAMVVRVDLADFFTSIVAARVRAVFAEAGYPDEVAYVLASLCTNVAPIDAELRAPLPAAASHADVAARFAAEARAKVRHLPQGAPTSPAIANLCAFRLDVRLTAAAARFDAVYTRYADDLVFSGDAAFAQRAAWFTSLVGAIALDEGFRVNHRKTRHMGQGGRQRIGGLVVNDRPRAPRDDYDRLRAILHNCARTGLDAQNRDHHPSFRAHLAGRIAWLASGDPVRAARLASLLASIPNDLEEAKT